jgi:hypothetical protein
MNVSNGLEVEEIIANEPARLEPIFVAEMHPWCLLFDSNRGRSSITKRDG